MKANVEEIFKCDVCGGIYNNEVKMVNKEGSEWCVVCYTKFCEEPTVEWLEKRTMTRETETCSCCGNVYTKSAVLEEGFCLACAWKFRGTVYSKGDLVDGKPVDVDASALKVVEVCTEVLYRTGYIREKKLNEMGKTYDPEALGRDDIAHRDITGFKKEEVYPLKIKQYLDRRVVGQDSAKKVLAVAAYNHYKRLQLGDSDIQKSNVMLVGPTGCGKTHLIRALSKALNVPVAFCQATTLTEAGYVGEDPTSVVERLYRMSGENVGYTQKGIIFIDEIDKLGGNAKKRDVGGTGVQQALLPIIEGAKVTINSKSGGKGVIIDTSNILFVFGGAFPAMEDTIRERMGESGDVPKENLLKYLRNEDFTEFGMIPELMGRIPVHAVLTEMDIPTLKKILIEPEDSIIGQYTKLFDFDGIRLEFTDEALTEVAQLALDEHTGARALRTILENALLETQFSLPGAGITKCTITKDVIKGNCSPIID